MSRNVPVAEKREEGGVLETIKVILQALAIALVIRTLLFQPFNIPSGSMIPTLLIGDYVFVSKYSYGYSNYSMPFGPDIFSGRILASPPNRGDVVVFKLPRDNATDYIKRVIGLPGDRIQVIDGRLYINGVIVQRTPLEKDSDGEPRRPRSPRDDLQGDAARATAIVRGRTYDHRNRGRSRHQRQHRAVRGAARSLFHDGRQSRQLARIRASRRSLAASASCPSSNFVGRAEIIFFSVRKANRPGASGAGHGPCGGTGCSARSLIGRKA